MFNALRWITRTGAQWRFLPNGLPPWPAVQQQGQRWLKAGCFEAMAADLRAILRLVAGREEQPTAVVLASRTLQSSPESGSRAGYDGHKKRKGSKVHLAVDTLGHLLALWVSAANEQDRAQVAALAAAVRRETGQNVQLAYVDQGYTGAEAAQDAHDHGIALEVVKLPAAKEGLRAPAPALGGGAQLCLGRALLPAGPRL